MRKGTSNGDRVHQLHTPPFLPWNMYEYQLQYVGPGSVFSAAAAAHATKTGEEDEEDQEQKEQEKVRPVEAK